MRLRASRCIARPVCHVRTDVYVSPFVQGVAKSGVWTDLFVHCASFPEDDVAADKACEERVETSLLATVHLLLNQQQGFVQRNVFHEIRGVSLGRLVYCSCPGAPATSNEYTGSPRLGGLRTHSPRPNRMAMINACGKRILTP